MALEHCLTSLSQAQAKKMAAEQCLAALSRAQAHVQKNPSKAEDSGTAKRTVQHMFTRVLNTLYCHREISDTQVALALLSRLGTEATSESFAYYGAGYMRNFVQKELELAENSQTAMIQEQEQQTSKTTMDDANLQEINKEDSSDCSHHEEDDEEAQDSNDDMYIASICATNHIPTLARAELGPAPFYKTCNPETEEMKSVPIPYQYHWRMRGQELRMMTPAEYYALVEVKKLSAASHDAQQESDDTEVVATSTDNLMQEEGQQEQHTESKRKDGRGRSKSRIFYFDETHPLHKTHCQYLRTKQPTLIINGFAPNHPGPPPKKPKKRRSDYKLHYQAWKKKADAFAMYYLCTYRPMPNHYSSAQKISNREDFSWDALCGWVKDMEQSERVVDKLRLDAMYNDIYGFRSKSKHQTLLSAYRSRKATVWTEEQLAENKELFSNFKTYRQDMLSPDDFGAEEYDASMHSYRPHDVAKVYQEEHYCREQKNALDSLYGEFQPQEDADSSAESGATMDHSAWEQVDHSILEEQTKAEVQAKTGKIQHTRLQQQANNQGVEDEDQGDSNASVTQENQNEDSTSVQSCDEEVDTNSSTCETPKTGGQLPAQTISGYLDSRELLKDQRKVVDRIRQYFDQLGAVDERNAIKPKPVNILMTGDPGAGKSYVIETIVEMAERMKVGHVQTTSYNGIAAVNIDGVTLLSLLGIDRNISSETSFLMINSMQFGTSYKQTAWPYLLWMRYQHWIL